MTAEISSEGSGRNLPTFILHFAIGPVLELLEEGGFDDDKTQSSSASGIGPYQATFCLDDGFAVGQKEGDVD